MKIVHSVTDLRTHLAQHRSTAFVATMGNLHAGHLALVQQAKTLADITVASIFVNRLQFLPHEDFDTYPRSWESDCQQLHAAGCDLLFAPGESELYPQPQTFKVHPPSALADILEGEFRPGFFVGVCTVVLKLLSCVQPQVALFGKKDYQQWMVIRRMVQQFNLPTRIMAVETLRAADGLALSSRNGYLSADERAQAVQLRQTLCTMAQAVRAGKADLNVIERHAMQTLQQRGWQPDYLTLRRQTDLQPPSLGVAGGEPLVLLGAAKLGATRLIDNLEL